MSQQLENHLHFEGAFASTEKPFYHIMFTWKVLIKVSGDTFILTTSFVTLLIFMLGRCLLETGMHNYLIWFTYYLDVYSGRDVKMGRSDIRTIFKSYL